MNRHAFAICAYKQSPYLESCVKSLLSQTVGSRIFIATSTPNEHISSVAEKYSVEVLTHDDGGIANDWNFAFRHADAETCTLAHQDDIYLPKYLEYSLKALEKSKKPLISFTHYQEIKSGKISPENINIIIKKYMLRPLAVCRENRFIRRRILSLGSTICCPSVTYNLAALEHFEFNREMTVSLDWDAWERISRLRGSFCYINKPLVLHRIHNMSETTNAIIDNRRSREDMLMFRRFWNKDMASFLLKIYSKSQDYNI